MVATKAYAHTIFRISVGLVGITVYIHQYVHSRQKKKACSSPTLFHAAPAAALSVGPVPCNACLVPADSELALLDSGVCTSTLIWTVALCAGRD